MELLVLDDGGADGDGGVHVAVPGQVADGAGVDAALDRLQLVDDLHGADLGRAGDGAGGEGGAQHVEGVQSRAQFADDVGDDVHDVGVALDDHALGEAHGADAGDAADVVAAQVDEHQVLGQFLGIGEQFLLQGAVLGLGGAATTGAGDGADGDHPVLQPGEDLRRGADDMEVPQVHVMHVGRGVEATQGAVEVDGPGLEGDGQALGQDHLHAVAGQDVVLDALHRRLEAGLGEAGDEVVLAHLARRAGGRARGAAAHEQDQGMEARLAVGQGLAGAGVQVGDEVHAPAEVVEDDDLVRDHEQDVRGAQGVRTGAGGQARLDVANGIVAEIARQAAGKAGHALGGRGDPEAALEGADPGQGVRGLFLLDQPAVAPDPHLVSVHLEAGAAGQDQDGIAPPLLAAVDGLEEAGVGTPRQLEVGAQGGVQIGEDLADQGDAVVALGGEAAELFWGHDLNQLPPADPGSRSGSRGPHPDGNHGCPGRGCSRNSCRKW